MPFSLIYHMTWGLYAKFVSLKLNSHLGIGKTGSCFNGMATPVILKSAFTGTRNYKLSTR